MAIRPERGEVLDKALMDWPLIKEYFCGFHGINIRINIFDENMKGSGA